MVMMTTTTCDDVDDNNNMATTPSRMVAHNMDNARHRAPTMA